MLSKNQIELIKKMYQEGTRIVLIKMDSGEIDSGEAGTVCGVDDMGNVLVNWDNGRGLNLLPDVDSFRKM